jgi:hypothetical protein
MLDPGSHGVISTMTNRRIAALALTLALAPLATFADSMHAPPARGLLLAFEHMYGVEGPFLEDGTPIGGIPGDELPWEIGRAVGRLDTAGNLFVRVKGLVFADDPIVPPDLRGINDETEFRAAVVCTTEENDQATQRAVFTAGFPATRSGNALIRARLALPSPCLAPIVLVLAGSEDKWFAVDGFEAEGQP